MKLNLKDKVIYKGIETEVIGLANKLKSYAIQYRDNKSYFSFTENISVFSDEYYMLDYCKDAKDGFTWVEESELDV